LVLEPEEEKEMVKLVFDDGMKEVSKDVVAFVPIKSAERRVVSMGFYEHDDPDGIQITVSFDSLYEARQFYRRLGLAIGSLMLEEAT